MKPPFSLSPRWRWRAREWAFALLFGALLGLLAWLSTRYVVEMDWSAGARNTLTEPSQTLLQRLSGAVRITAFARPNPALRRALENLIARYQRHKPDIELAFVNPDTDPERVRALGISREGELYVEYQGRGERLQQLNEQGLTSLLQRLLRHGERSVLFLAGHGERRPRGGANHDLGNFSRELEQGGIVTRELNLSDEPGVPEDSAALVIASPRIPLLPGEVQWLLAYLRRGGNLLWLLEPNANTTIPRELADMLGIRLAPGIVMDTDAAQVGVDNPAFVVVANYAKHPIVRDLRTLTLFPFASALETDPAGTAGGWQATPLLFTTARAWVETATGAEPPRFDADRGDRAGPLALALALTRTVGERQQRVVVVGDGDFLANAYLGNGGNLQLGLNMFNWLATDDALIAIQNPASPDQTLRLTQPVLVVLGSIFLLGLPIALVPSGWLITWRRRRR